MHEKLDESNFLLYAAKYYDNPSCTTTDEFIEDLNRFKYIKRLLNRYELTGELKDRLIMNHLIILYNMFGEATTKMLFYKLKGQLKFIKPFLILIGRMPEIVHGLSDGVIRTSDIPMDENIVKILRKI